MAKCSVEEFLAAGKAFKKVVRKTGAPLFIHSEGTDMVALMLPEGRWCITVEPVEDGEEADGEPAGEDLLSDEEVLRAAGAKD